MVVMGANGGGNGFYFAMSTVFHSVSILEKDRIFYCFLFQILFQAKYVKKSLFI